MLTGRLPGLLPQGRREDGGRGGVLFNLPERGAKFRECRPLPPPPPPAKLSSSKSSAPSVRGAGHTGGAARPPGPARPAPASLAVLGKGSCSQGLAGELTGRQVRPLGDSGVPGQGVPSLGPSLHYSPALGPSSPPPS